MMKKMNIGKLVVFIGIMLTSGTVYSQVSSISNPIVAWQFSRGYEGASGNSSGREAAISSTTTHENLEVSVLKRGLGAGQPGGTVLRTFNGTFPNGGTKSDALQNNRYFEFSIQAKPGYKVSFNALRVVLRRTATSPNTYRWAFSVNESGKADALKSFTELGTDDVTVEGTSAGGNLQPQVDLFAVKALQNVSADSVITFRLYAWGGTVNGGTFAIGKSNDNDGTGTSNNIALAVGGVLSPVAALTNFEPWDKVKWASHYDASGKITKPFLINTDVLFASRTSPWQPEFSAEFSGSYLFEIVKQGVKVDGNDVIIDLATNAQNQPLENLYSAGPTPWTKGSLVNAMYYALPEQSWVGETVIKNFTIKGFNRGIRFGDIGSVVHPVVIDSCIFMRNRFALYTNGNNAVIQHCAMIENGYGAVYSGYRSYGNIFQYNTFRDNALSQNQPSYGEFIGDTFYDTQIIHNTFAKSLVTSPSLVHIGISVYRNAGEGNNLREDIPHGLIIENNTFEGYSIAVHLASRMGRYPSYDISKEGRDYAFYNLIKNNDITDCSIGIKINSEGNTIDGNRFVNTNYEIVLHPVFFTLKNTTINNQAGATVHIWYVKSDYSAVPNQAYLFQFHDDANGSITRAEKRVEVFSATGTPAFTATGGLKANEFVLNPAPPADPLWDHRVGNPLVKRYGEFQQNLPGDEVVAIWDEKISRIENTDYYSILVCDQHGTEINRCGRSLVGWSQLAVGYFVRTSGEMEIAAVPKTAIDGKYPVYIFRRGYAEPAAILYPDNTDPKIRITTDAEHHLVVTYGDNLPVALLSFTGRPDGKQIRLNWETVSGQDDAYFEVQRSSDSLHFSMLGTVNGGGGSTDPGKYNYVDTNPGTGVNYYRLKQVDVSGNATLSGIVPVKMNLADYSLKVHASADDTLTSFFINSPYTRDAVITITDLTGRQLARRLITLQQGSTVFQWNVPLSAGAYIAKLTPVSGEALRVKFVK